MLYCVHPFEGFDVLAVRWAAFWNVETFLLDAISHATNDTYVCWEYRQGTVCVWVAGKHCVIPLFHTDHVWAVPFLSCMTASCML